MGNEWTGSLCAVCRHDVDVHSKFGCAQPGCRCKEWPTGEHERIQADESPIGTAEVAVGTGDEVYTLATDGLAYTCQDCGASFPVDPVDPFDAHGKYLDHLAKHDDADPGECSETCDIEPHEDDDQAYVDRCDDAGRIEVPD